MPKAILYIVILVILSSCFSGVGFAAVDSVGTNTIDECGGGWQWTSAGFFLGAWLTPNEANLKVDSGLVGIGDDYDDPDSAVIVIYGNSSKSPASLLAVSDTAIATGHHDCEMYMVHFNHESIPQDDSIWIGIFIFGLNDRADAGLCATVGQYIYYHLNYSSIDDPWDTNTDSYDANWYKPSVRIYLSVAGEQKLPPRRRRMFLGGF